MKLISMTEYTLQTLDEEVTVSYGIRDKVRQIRAYAEFLKQPLELWMFVPCDEHGVFMPPLEMCCSGADCGCMGMPTNVSSQKEIDDYLEAENRVLFKNCFYDQASETAYHKSYEIPLFHKLLAQIDMLTIEDIMKVSGNSDIQLTQTAIKQLN